MSTVRRISTFVQEQEIDDGEGFNPLVAIGIATGRGEWRIVSNEQSFEVSEGGQTFQLAAGRAALGRGPAGVVELADADGLGAGASEAEEV